jgi:hypothetical protein
LLPGTALLLPTPDREFCDCGTHHEQEAGRLNVCLVPDPELLVGFGQEEVEPSRAASVFCI